MDGVSGVCTCLWWEEVQLAWVSAVSSYEDMEGLMPENRESWTPEPILEWNRGPFILAVEHTD